MSREKCQEQSGGPQAICVGLWPTLIEPPMPRLGIAALLALTTLSACGGMEIRSRYDPAADFARYRTYDWMAGSRSSDRRILPIRTEVDDRLRFTIEDELAAKGIVKTDAAEAALLVGYTIDIKETQVSSFRDLLDYRYAGGTDSAFGAYVRGYEQGQLTLNLFDGGSHDLIWSASATAVVEPENGDSKVEEAVRLMLERFPPAPPQ